MPNLSRIIALTDETHRVVAAGDRELAERVGWELCEVFSAELGQGCPVSEYTPELARLQFDALSAILEIHIMRGNDSISASVPRRLQGITGNCGMLFRIGRRRTGLPWKK